GGARDRTVDRGDVAYLPHGAPRRAAGNGLRGAQRIRADVHAGAEVATNRSEGFAPAGRGIQARRAMEALPIRGELVPVAGMRPGEVIECAAGDVVLGRCGLPDLWALDPGAD